MVGHNTPEWSRTYYRKNRERIKERSRIRWRNLTPEKRAKYREQQRQYRKRNPDKERLRRRNDYTKHRETKLAKRRAYYWRRKAQGRPFSRKSKPPRLVSKVRKVLGVPMVLARQMLGMHIRGDVARMGRYLATKAILIPPPKTQVPSWESNQNEVAGSANVAVYI